MNNTADLLKIINSLKIATALFNYDGKLVAYNNSVITLWSLDKDSLEIEPNIVEFFEILRDYNTYSISGDFRSFCNDIYKKTTNRNPYNYHNILLLNNGDYIKETVYKSNIGMLISWENISEQQNLIYKLNHYQSIYEKIINNTPVPLITVNSAGIITDHNTRFIEMFSVNIDYIIDSHITKITDVWKQLSPDNSDTTFILNSILDGKQINIPINNYIVYSLPLPNKDIIVFFIKQINNNSDNLFPSYYIDHINNLYNQIISDISYISTNDLSDILSLSGLILDQHAGNINIRQKNYIEKINNAASRILNNINNKVSIIGLNNTSDINLSPVDIHTIIASCIQYIKPRLQDKNINLQLNLPKEECLINSDYNLFNKAINLLLSYMIEQNNYAGEIIIEVKSIALNNKDKNEYSLIIKDNAKFPIISYEDKNRYDIKLFLEIMEKLKISYQTSYQNKKYREIHMQL